MLNIDSIVDDSSGHPRYRVPNPELKELGAKILSLYIEAVSRITGRVPTVSKKYHIHFYKAAQLCMDRNQTPEEFVRIQVEGMASTGKYWPCAIACASFQDESHQRERMLRRDLYTYQSQLHLLKARIELYGPELALRDPANAFSPLFRAAMAYKYGFMPIFRKYRSDAILEFRASETAREAFGDLASVLQ